MWRWMWLVCLGCGARVPVFSEGSDDFLAYELPESEGECFVDADCDGEGCGSDCTAQHADTGMATCAAPAHLSYSSCGCVSGRCRWFMDP
jgi:hypothetical protein